MTAVKPKVKTKAIKAMPRTANLISEKDIAMDFAQKIHEKFDRIVKATVLFGSQAKETSRSGSDIDIIVIVDDASIKWDLELIAWYREELGKIISAHASKVNCELHINTIKLSTWWQDLLHGDPVILNILRYGEALIDSGGFFNPIKMLFLDGKIKSTPEAAYVALQRAPIHLARSRVSEMGAVEGVYWAMVDSAQAALITAGRIPPSPENIPLLLKEEFVDSGLLKMEAVSAMHDLYNLHKAIEHNEITDVKGIEIDHWQETAEKFISDMARIINKMLTEKGAK